MFKLTSSDYNKAKKSIGNIPVVCPCCSKEKDWKETTLPDNFYNLYQSGYNITKECTTLEKVSLVLLQYINDKSQAIHWDRSTIMYHTRLWACNQCIEEEKAIVADIVKQQPSYEGPCLVYLDLFFNCHYCNEKFWFYAKEQKHWYEDLKLKIETKAIRCPECRKKKKAQKQIMDLLAKQTPLTISELQELISCYKTIGAEEKAKEYTGQLKKRMN